MVTQDLRNVPASVDRNVPARVDRNVPARVDRKDDRKFDTNIRSHTAIAKGACPKINNVLRKTKNSVKTKKITMNFYVILGLLYGSRC